MPNRNHLLSFLVILGLGSMATPALGQALIPHTLQLDSAGLEKQGLFLAQEAYQLAQFQQFDMALPRARLATQLAPKNFKAWTILGGLYLQTNKYNESIAALQKAQTLAPKEPSILFLIGSANFQQGNYNKAIENLQAGLRLKPNDAQGLFDLGNTYYKIGKLPDAIATYNKAVIQPNWEKWPAINNIGLVRYEQGNVDEAIKQWRAAVSIDKQAAEPLMAMGVALYNKGDREQGLKMGEAAIKIDGRYGDLEFLRQNLWGDRLLSATKKFLQTPRIQTSLQNRSSQPQQQIRLVPQ